MHAFERIWPLMLPLVFLSQRLWLSWLWPKPTKKHDSGRRRPRRGGCRLQARSRGERPHGDAFPRRAPASRRGPVECAPGGSNLSGTCVFRPRVNLHSWSDRKLRLLVVTAVASREHAGGRRRPRRGDCRSPTGRHDAPEALSATIPLNQKEDTSLRCWPQQNRQVNPAGPRKANHPPHN